MILNKWHPVGWVRISTKRLYLLFNIYFHSLAFPAFPDLEIVSTGEQVVTGDSVDLPCFAEGSPLQDVKWEFTDVFGTFQYTLEYTITDSANSTGFMNITLHTSDTSLLDVEQQYAISPPDDTIETQLYGLLTISNITAFEAGWYKCTLTNIHGTESYTASVGVQRKWLCFQSCHQRYDCASHF